MASSVIACPHCGKENRPNARFCQHCGGTLPPSEVASRGDIPGGASAGKPLPPALPPPPSKKIPAPSTARPSQAARPSLIKRLSRGLDRFDEQVDDVWRTLTRQNKPRPAQPARVETASKSPEPRPTPPAARSGATMRLPLPAPLQVGEIINNTYRVLETHTLHRSNFYRALSFQCLNNHLNQPNAGDTCVTCNSPLPVYLMHERYSSAGGPASHVNGGWQLLYEMSTGSATGRLDRAGSLPGILPHFHIFDAVVPPDTEQRQYVVTRLPANTRQVLPIAHHIPAGSEAAIAWCIELAKGLSYIHQRGYTFYSEEAIPEFLEPVVVLDGQMAAIADLTSCTQLTTNTASTGAIPSPSPLSRDIIFLARLLYTLTTGDRQHILRTTPSDVPTAIDHAPPVIRRIVNRIRIGEYSDLRTLINDLIQAPPPEAPRSLRQNAGYRTDVGRVRDHNEDFVGRYSFGMVQSPDTPEVGLYIVADGMGGHQSGEVASKDVVRAVVEHIQENLNILQAAPKVKRATVRLEHMTTPGEVLQQAIQRANQILYTAKRSIGSNRGTTITAALVVGDSCSIANVGDSRTYLFHNEELCQITRDHSLVASMLAAGMIKPEEVRSHPQRNQILRQLGDKPNVEVDIFSAMLAAGDKLILCSDGLWEMVLDEEIQNLVAQSPTAQAASDRLVELANRAGGEDNISVMVISIE